MALPLAGRQARHVCVDHFQILGDYKWRIHNDDNRTFSPLCRLPEQPLDVTDIEIARRAYELYEQRGCTHDYDNDDWLLAERDLGLARRTTAV